MLSIFLILCLLFGGVTCDAASDNVYDENSKISALLSGLNIIEENKGGEFPTDEVVSRAMLAEIIVRLNNISDVNYVGSLPFKDVGSSYWAYNSIGNAHNLGYINGYGDGTFRPDEAVNYIDVIRVMVDLTGYGPYADKMGEYPSGYLAIAAQKGIMSGVKAEMNQPMTRSQIEKIIYNTLEVDVLTQVSFGSSATYEVRKGVTLLSKNMGVKKLSGVITSSGIVSLNEDGARLLDDDVEIENIVYKNKTDIDYYNYVGFSVNYYVKELKDSDVEAVVYVDLNKKRNNAISIREKDIAPETSVNTIVFYNEQGTKVERAILSDNVSVIYNSRLLLNYTADDFKPYYGEITLIDNNNDSTYEVVIIKDIDTYVIERVEYEKGEIWDKYKPKRLLLTESGKHYRFYNNNGTVAGNPLYNLTFDNVVDAMVSKDSMYITTIASTHIISGSISQTSFEDKVIMIDQAEYRMAKEFSESSQRLDVGYKGEFFLNSLGEIAGCKIDYSGQYLYGYLVDYKKQDGIGNRVHLKIFTIEGKMEVFEVAAKLTFNDEPIKIMAHELLFRLPSETGSQLIQYLMNDKQLITGIRPATNNLNGEERFDNEIFSLDYISPINGVRIYNYTVGANYRITNNTIIFFIPVDKSDERGFRTGKKEMVSGDTRNASLFLYDTNEDGDVRVLVRNIGSGGAAPPGLFKQNLVVVDRLARVLLDDGMEGYRIYGYQSGKNISFLAESGDEVNFALQNYWDIRYKGIYSGKTVKDLLKGDIIGVNVDINGNVENILYYLSPANLPEQFGEVMSNGGTPTKDNHLVTLHTAYGVVKRKYKNSIVVNANGDGTDKEWNKTFFVLGCIVYLYDSSSQSVSVETVGEINEGDIVLVKTVSNVPKEVVIIR